MKPKLLHQEAMNCSFRAKESAKLGNYSEAYELYLKAAELESNVAEFYFERPDLEPTRSLMIRSAAFLNLKAGLNEQAKKFIFFGLLNSTDELIKEQLNNALEIAVSLNNLTSEMASKEFNYLTVLRQKSIHYVLEPSSSWNWRSVSVEMIRDFFDNYLKSIKSYAIAKLKRLPSLDIDFDHWEQKEYKRLINPLVTGSSYGSFKFSVANDFVPRQGETEEIVALKSEIVNNYHNEIFINPLNDNDIEKIKHNFSGEEINEIFRPLTKIKSNNSPYKIGYYNEDDFEKKFIARIINKQKKKLLPFNPITAEDIGELENSIIHTRNTSDGKVYRKTIFKEHLKSAEYDIEMNIIEPTNYDPLILNQEIIVAVNFSSDIGFTISYDDFKIESTNIEYPKALKGFHDAFYYKVISLIKKDKSNDEDVKDMEIINSLINNPDRYKS